MNFIICSGEDISWNKFLLKACNEKLPILYISFKSNRFLNCISWNRSVFELLKFYFIVTLNNFFPNVIVRNLRIKNLPANLCLRIYVEGSNKERCNYFSQNIKNKVAENRLRSMWLISSPWLETNKTVSNKILNVIKYFNIWIDQSNWFRSIEKLMNEITSICILISNNW